MRTVCFYGVKFKIVHAKKIVRITDVYRLKKHGLMFIVLSFLSPIIVKDLSPMVTYHSPFYATLFLKEENVLKIVLELIKILINFPNFYCYSHENDNVNGIDNVVTHTPKSHSDTFKTSSR